MLTVHGRILDLPEGFHNKNLRKIALYQFWDYFWTFQGLSKTTRSLPCPGYPHSVTFTFYFCPWCRVGTDWRSSLFLYCNRNILLKTKVVHGLLLFKILVWSLQHFRYTVYDSLSWSYGIWVSFCYSNFLYSLLPDLFPTQLWGAKGQRTCLSVFPL